ncbi:O-antigen ligase family protein [Jeotgalibacillus sp. JSM ZJ347]|uniref:O-antigen ligase family protein n=1 Tax=Jeotgalibacillus sp. JSM ZJ347 TaxID=3342117 RepID=UPI0035A95AA5
MNEAMVSHKEKFFIFLILFSLIFLQRFAITIGDIQLSPVFLLSLLSITVLYVLNTIEIDQRRLTLFLLAVSGLSLVSLYALMELKSVGVASLLSVIVFYLPLLFIHRKKGSLDYILSTYQAMMIIVAIIGIGQYAAQFTGSGFYDPLQSLPEQFILQDYNTLNPMSWDSPVIKANGMFMLEPSFFSKMLAIGLVIEFITKRRIIVMLLFFIGMLLAFSGTGFIILAIVAVPLLIKMKPVQFFLVTLICGISVYIMFAQGYGDIFVERLEEFNTPRTSGHVRFIAPWQAYGEFFRTEDTSTVIFGYGAGSVQEYYSANYTFDELSPSHITAHPIAYIKLLVEYGIIGGILFTIFIVYTFFSITHHKILTLALFINYSFLTASLLQTTTIYVCFILGTLAVKNSLEKKEQEAEQVCETWHHLKVINAKID